MMKACFTGHRYLPSHLKDSIVSQIRASVIQSRMNGYDTFYCGGALGFATRAALEVIRLKKDYPDLKLCMVIPCKNQAARWTQKDRMLYEQILDKADETHVLSPIYYSGCMQVRNKYMVDHSSLCICYLTSFHGGTASTVRYADYRGLDIINLAMDLSLSHDRLREKPCYAIYTSPSAKENATTAPSFLLSDRKLRHQNILT